MNILYVCADRGIPLLGHKGASVHVRAITAALQRLGHQVTIAIDRIGEGNPQPTVHQIQQLERDRSSAHAQLVKLIDDQQIELVIERYSLQSGAARDATKQCALPLALEVNARLAEEATRYRGLRDPHAVIHEATTLQSADRIHVVSSELLRYVQTVAPDVPAGWIPNGVDIAAFRTDPAAITELQGRTIIGFAGSMKPWHGVAELLTAFKSVHGQHPRAALLLVGGGPLEDGLRAQVAKSELAADVMITGHLPHQQVPPLIRRFDIAVAPYLANDNFYFSPLKVLEYLAANRPILYAAQGDLPELIGSAGVGYPPGDLYALTDLLGELLASPPLRSGLAEHAAQRAENFDWSVIARRVVDFAAAARE